MVGGSGSTVGGSTGLDVLDPIPGLYLACLCRSKLTELEYFLESSVSIDKCVKSDMILRSSLTWIRYIKILAIC